MEDNNPGLVSICIPAFNAEKYIRRCIYSILAQTYTNFEIVVGDDDSSDNTSDIVRSIYDKRIRYFKNDVNLGWRGNVKKCYEHATGSFVTMLPVDDYLHPDFIKTSVNIFNQNDNIGIWAGSCINVDDNGNEIGKHTRTKLGLIDAKEYFRHTFQMVDVSPPAETMIRKKCFDLVRGNKCYNNEYNQFPEINLYLKIAKAGFCAFHSNDFLTYRTYRKDSLTEMFGRMSFVFEDNYRIFYSYKDDEFLDNYILESTNNFLAYQVLRSIMHQWKNKNFSEVIKLLRVLNLNDYYLRGKSFISKAKRWRAIIKIALSQGLNIKL
jgi:glycosyltransferase involved in cell wall biosynthesis